MIVIKRQASCLIACILLLIFSVTQFAEALHHHVDEQEHAQVSAIKKHNTSKQGIKLVSACKLCKDLSHLQLHYFDMGEMAYSYIPAAVLMPVQPDTAQQLFDTAVNLWTNKGPPSSLSFIALGPAA